MIPTEPGKKAIGTNTGDQHQRDADDGAGDLGHRLARGLARRQPFLGHDALDVLDHHDRVVDENADGEHHARTASAC